MFKSKMKTVVGALALSGALLVPSLSVDASGLTWVRDAYPGYDYKFDSNKKIVTVYYYNNAGETKKKRVKCDEMIENECYVYDHNIEPLNMD